MLSFCSGGKAAIAVMICCGATWSPRLDNGSRPHRLGDRVDAAQAAAGRSRDMPAPLAEPRRTRGLQPHLHVDTIVEGDDIDRDDVILAVDDTLGQAESHRKIFEISRRSHHDGVGAAVIRPGQLPFLPGWRGHPR